MDTTQALKDAENALRDFIADMLSKSLGQGWEEKCGVSADRIEKWRERKQVEATRQETGVVDERLLYYTDFYDLKNILKKHWSAIFSPALGDWKTLDVWLSELEKLRDPDAHRRELLPHQHHLALGISGEIRTRIVRFRSMQETSKSYFPRIDCIRDSLGSIWTYSETSVALNTGKNVRPGDTIDFVITASDPMGDPLQYSLAVGLGPIEWQDSNVFSYTFKKTNVGELFELLFRIRSPRAYHAHSDWDAHVQLFYRVLPPKE
jgi:Swt1-like HEPN